MTRTMRNEFPIEFAGGNNASLDETLSRHFPIVPAEKGYYFSDDGPELQEGTIAHFYTRVPSGKENLLLDRFVLGKTIGGLHYIFCLQENYDHTYGLVFQTAEYKFATTNLSREGQDELAKTLASFIESVSDAEGVSVNTVSVSPADASYSSREIEDCRSAILALPGNTLSREELMERYKSFEIFDYYQELSGKDFLPEHYNSKSRREGRSRLFKRLFRRHLRGWAVENDQYGGPSFTLRKNKKSDDSNGKRIDGV